MRARTLVLAVSVVLGIAAPARAQEGAAVSPSEELVIRFSEHPEWVDVQALARRLSVLAGVQVVGVERAETAAMLSIEWHTPAYARIAITRPGGAPTARLVELPEDATERVETIAILATNLLRDESTELLAMLRRAPEESAPAPPILVLVEADAPPAAEPVSLPSVEEQVPAIAVEEEPAPQLPSAPFLRLGLAAHLGSVPHGAGHEADTISGLEVSWTSAWLALGVRELNVGALNNQPLHVDLAPFAEARATFDFLALYGQLGVHLQVDEDARFGVAPMGVIGARFRLVPEFSIGVETALRVIATDTFVTGAHTLPQWSVPWTGGLALLFHIS